MKLHTEPLPKGTIAMSKQEYEESASDIVTDPRDIVIKKMIERNKLTVDKLNTLRAYNDSIKKLTNEIDAILKDIETNQLSMFARN